jgi:hypothetical protein
LFGVSTSCLNKKTDVRLLGRFFKQVMQIATLLVGS